MEPEPVDEIQKIAKEEALRHADDIEHAVDAAMKRSKRLADFDGYIDELIRSAIRQMVYDFRHADNVAARNESGGYDIAPKVKAGEATNAVASRVYMHYMIAGKTLGMIRGEELAPIADAEAERANGHQFNARLCYALAAKVPADKLVRECVKETELRRLFAKLQEKPHGKAA